MQLTSPVCVIDKGSDWLTSLCNWLKQGYLYFFWIGQNRVLNCVVDPPRIVLTSKDACTSVNLLMCCVLLGDLNHLSWNLEGRGRRVKFENRGGLILLLLYFFLDNPIKNRQQPICQRFSWHWEWKEGEKVSQKKSVCISLFGLPLQSLDVSRGQCNLSIAPNQFFPRQN